MKPSKLKKQYKYNPERDWWLKQGNEGQKEMQQSLHSDRELFGINSRSI